MSISNSSVRANQVLILIKQDIARTLQGTHGQLFLIFFAIFWFWVLWQCSGGVANSLAQTSNEFDQTWLLNIVFSWIFDGDQQVLFAQHPATLSLYYLLVISTMPLFVLLAASNQTAGDIGSKYLRFLIPRCTRTEIYVGRFLGNCISINFAYLIVTLCAAFLSLSIDNNASLINVFMYSLQITLSIVFYSLPFVAIMALCSASLGSASLSALTGSSLYSVLALIITFVSIRWPEIKNIGYLMPSVTKSLHLSLDFGDLLSAGMVAALFVAIFSGAGWYVFQRRDI